MRQAGSVLNAVHGAAVFRRRVRVLSQTLAAIVPPGPAGILDIGAGNGVLARSLMSLRPELVATGVDVLERPQSLVPIAIYDGVTLPFADGSFDYSLLVDVLHHTDDPVIVLREAARVARRGVIIKDHAVTGILARPTLRFMDWVGNRGHGVRLPYNYLTPAQWDAAFAAVGLVLEAEVTALGLYPAPFSWIFDRDLHFVARLGITPQGLASLRDSVIVPPRFTGE